MTDSREQSPDSLEKRIWRLEQFEAIRRLKARYWYSCDHKDVEAVRACFADGPINVDFDGTGKHKHRDNFYELFEKFSLREFIVEHHHGAGSQLELTGDTAATGTWSLQYRLTNTSAKTLYVIGGYYNDIYELIDGEWLIRESQFRTVSTAGYGWAKGDWKLLHVGKGVLSGPDVAESE